MKKKLILFLMIACAVCLLAGCGEKAKDKENKESITVGAYKGLEIEKIVQTAVTDEDVENDIHTTLQTLKSSQIKGPAQMGDITTIDYVGKLDGVEFQGGTAENQQLTLGSKKFIEGFEEKIVGHNVGEVFDITVTFPEDYKNSAELAGKEVVFTITLDAIIRIPELTDALLPEIGTKAKTVAEYKELVKKDLEQKMEDAAKSQKQAAVLEALGKVTKVSEYPQDKLIRVTKDLVFAESYGAMRNGLTIDTAFYSSYGETVEEVVKEQVVQEMAVEYVAEKEGLTISEEEYSEQVSKMAAAYGETNLTQFVEDFEMVYGQGYIKRMMLQEKVGAFLVKHCKEVEKK